MDPGSLTDEVIQMLLKCDKLVKSKRPKETTKAKHTERNIEVESCDGNYAFTVFTRQSLLIPDSYTAGLMWHATSSQKVILTRYNGSDHVHGNPLENEEFGFTCHVHVATQRYLGAGRKIEHYATPTTRYNSLNEALDCLMKDCNIAWPAQDARQGVFELQ